MQARRPATRRTARRGFTLIELLVVISIIATLMALLLPAIQNAREAARRTECLNNQRNIATAMIGWATAHKNQLPAYGYWTSDGGSPTPTNIPQRSWVVELLPYMDQQGVYDRWDTSSGVDVAVNDASIGGPYSFAVLSCPDDNTAFQVPGALSYVVNAGFGDAVGAGTGNGTDHDYRSEALDWNASGGATIPDDSFDTTITRATGVFWAEYENVGAGASERASANLGRIYDGTSNTIMLSENVFAGTDLVNTVNNVWASPEHRSCTFIAPVELGTATPSLVYDSAATTDGFKILTGQETLAFPNASKNSGTEGNTPYPTSLHPGIVVVAFCDGTVRTLNDSIDESVYLRLMTPDGTRLRGAFAVETPLSDTDF